MFKSDFIGTIFGIIGALIIALNIGYNLLGFVFFIISNIFYIRFGLDIKNYNIVVLNFVFFLINLIGIYFYS